MYRQNVTVVVILCLHQGVVFMETVWILLRWDLRLINRINKAQEAPHARGAFFLSAAWLFQQPIVGRYDVYRFAVHLYFFALKIGNQIQVPAARFLGRRQ